jgi:hypothetical protein
MGHTPHFTSICTHLLCFPDCVYTFSDFPEVVANMIINGVSHDITPKNNTSTNAWEQSIYAGRHEDDSKSQTEHLKDFSTWTVRHFCFVLAYIF